MDGREGREKEGIKCPERTGEGALPLKLSVGKSEAFLPNSQGKPLPGGRKSAFHEYTHQEMTRRFSQMTRSVWYYRIHF
jgi:hypothetical protein